MELLYSPLVGFGLGLVVGIIGTVLCLLDPDEVNHDDE